MDSADRRSDVVEADRAGSCSTPLCSQLQPQRTASAAAPGSPQLIYGHAGLGSAHKGTLNLLPLTD